jgi:hypothetical protein
MALLTIPAGQLVIAGQAIDQQLLIIASLALIAAFVVWLLFFSGNGTFGDFIEDIKSAPNRKQKDPFPVPQFDKSKVLVPVPPKSVRKPLKYRWSPDEIDLKLDSWAKDLRSSLKEVRVESMALAEKYKDVPLKRARPEAAKKPADAKTSKPKPAAKTAVKTSKKAAGTAKSKAPKAKG